jgi:hypothetical protein
MTKHLTLADLRQFTGSETIYRHPLVRRVVYSEGAQHVASAGEAYWLLDEIAFRQCDTPAVQAQEFQVWTLTVQPDRCATLTCGDGNGRVVFTKEIDWTDFPLEQIELWVSNSTIYLPSEH